MGRAGRCARAAGALVLAAALAATSGGAAAAAVPAPASGAVLFGVNLDWATDSPAAYAQRSGLAPAQVGEFVRLPLTDDARAALSTKVDALAAARARLFLTVEPDSLSAVTDAEAGALASLVAGYEARGVQTLVRFAHEMNGSWYPWSQQPTAYVAAFRRVAAAVHAAAPSAAMVWSPNYGGGYPYTGGTYAAASGTADHAALDTNGNGVLSMADDPYAPYYPGDDAVDWVGLTAYHFGHAWPFGENEVPEAGKLVQQVLGTYTGGGQYEDQSALPDFHAFAVAHDKPLALSETGALFSESPPEAGASESAVKTAWLDQVYGASTRQALPRLALVNWFEVRKLETETGSWVDWRATARPDLLEHLRGLVATGWVFGGASSAPAPAPAPAPATTPGAVQGLAGSTTTKSVSGTWQAPTTDGGSALTGYRACLGSTCRDLPAGTTSVLFGGLPKRTTYVLAVQARNAQGLGASTSVTVRTR